MTTQSRAGKIALDDNHIAIHAQRSEDAPPSVVLSDAGREAVAWHACAGASEHLGGAADHEHRGVDVVRVRVRAARTRVIARSHPLAPSDHHRRPERAGAASDAQAQADHATLNAVHTLTREVLSINEQQSTILEALRAQQARGA